MTQMRTDLESALPGHGPLGMADIRLKARIGEILNRHPAVGLAVGVIRHGRLELFSGHGLADIASNTPVTEDTVFRIGSITKTFTAIAVLQLWEQGRVDLDAPANHYLRGYRLIPAKAGHRPATLRQLLTHTAGLPELLHPWRAYTPILGQTVRFGQPLPTLAEFYPGRAPSGGRARHQLHLQQPWVRHPRSAGRGREWHAPGPLFPRARLRAARHGRHRPAAIEAG
jgi:CubicO group peptidase (beta-lactamase class C family)